MIDTHKRGHTMNRDTTCKHTPGPWRVEPRDPRCGPEINILGPSPYQDGDQKKDYTATYVAVVKACDKEYNLTTAGGWLTPHMEEATANGRMIAELPEMYATLTAIVDAWAVSDARRYAEKGGWLAGSIDRAKQILAKLEGK